MVKRALLYCGLLLLGRSAAADRGRIREVQHWGYQLQGRVQRAAANLDCLVVDPDGGEGKGSTPLTAAQVRALKQRPGRPDRIVLAYLSIGEAEDYRWYWQAAWSHAPPAFLAPENKQWRGNFKVRYWDPGWQALVFESLDRIVAAGFDGVYLDIIDAFEYFGPDGPHAERQTAAADMSQLVLRLAHRARAERAAPDFLVVPQNGATIVEQLGPAAPTYLEAIDAIGAEDTFFFGGRRENNELKVQKEVLAALERFRDAGKPVLSVEYLTDRAKLRQYLALARAHRFVPCIARRSLDQLVELKD